MSDIRRDADDRRLIRQCLRIAEIYDEVIPSSGADEYRFGGANPYHDRTDSGLCLEIYYGLPSKLWTPWGGWKFSGTTSCRFGDMAAMLDGFLSRLTVRTQIEFRQGKGGDYGPVYTVLAVEDDPVEEMRPHERVREVDPMGAGRAREAEWGRLGGPWTDWTPEGNIRYVDGKPVQVFAQGPEARS